jgi:hypothetical protein
MRLLFDVLCKLLSVAAFKAEAKIMYRIFDLGLTQPVITALSELRMRLYSVSDKILGLQPNTCTRLVRNLEKNLIFDSKQNVFPYWLTLFFTGTQ